MKTTPTPNKNGSYGIKLSRSSYAIKVGSCTIFSVKVPLFQRIFTPYDPSFYGIFGSTLFANMGSGGGQNCFQNGTNHTGGSTILKLLWGGNLLYFHGFGDLQPYETWKFRICSESVHGVFPVPDFTPEMLSRTRGTSNSGRHRGGCNFTYFLRFSGCSKMSLFYLETCTP